MICFKDRYRKLFLFFFLIICSQYGLAQNADITLLQNINLHRPQKLDAGFRFVANTTYPVSLAVPMVMLGTGYLKKDSALKNQGLQTGAALVIAAVITEGLKRSIQRPRPFVTYPFIEKATEGDGSSFPSGHVSIAFATATSLYLWNHKWYVAVPSFVWASTVAYARMDLGVHYPSDVLAGAIVGSASAFLSYKANKWIHKKRQMR